MDTTEVLLESWRRNGRIIDNIAASLDSGKLEVKQDEEGWPIAEHLAHIHDCRWGWLNKVSAPHAEGMNDLWTKVDENWVASRDVEAIRAALAQSGRAVGEAVKDLVAVNATQVGPYSHPIFYLQHMLWHDGYHVALIFLALRRGGFEVAEDWEEEQVWSLWRS